MLDPGEAAIVRLVGWTAAAALRPPAHRGILFTASNTTTFQFIFNNTYDHSNCAKDYINKMKNVNNLQHARVKLGHAQ